jgi:hypothetical protein
VLAKEPANRYRTADQFGRILSTFRRRSLETTSPISRTAIEPDVPVYDQTTHIYSRPPQPTQPAGAMVYETNETPASTMEAETQIHQVSAAPSYRPQSTEKPTPPQPERLQLQPAPKTVERDWVAIILGILALVALLGLIPLWLFVYLAYTQ